LRLLLGSEGSFGVITEAWMRVVPRPLHRSSASVRFSDWNDAVAAARSLARSGLQPSNCRLLDATEAKLHRVAFDGSHVLLLGFESADHPVAPLLTLALEHTAAHRGVVHGEPRHKSDAPGSAGASGARSGDAGSWRQAFLDAPYLQSALVSLGVLCDTFETSCTWAAFPAMHAAITAAVHQAMREEGGGGVVSCRFTHVYPDGPAPYYTFLCPALPGRELAQWTHVKAAARHALGAHGGTITHHHAVGRTHAPGYRREVPPLLHAGLASLKRTWDPDRILNPGVLDL
jgi:alkyldihydroxyacetonephosphate synthase